MLICSPLFQQSLLSGKQLITIAPKIGIILNLTQPSTSNSLLFLLQFNTFSYQYFSSNTFRIKITPILIIFRIEIRQHYIALQHQTRPSTTDCWSPSHECCCSGDPMPLHVLRALPTMKQVFVTELTQVTVMHF